MIPLTKEQNELYDRLENAKDPKEIASIRKQLKELAEKQNEQYNNCPFEH